MVEEKEPTVEEINDAFQEAIEEDRINSAAYRTFPAVFSEQGDKLFAALSAAQGEIANIDKDSEGYGYKYASLPSLIEAIRAPMSKHELCVAQWSELIRGENPTLVTHTRVGHSSGQFMQTSLELPFPDMPQINAAQLVGVVNTYGRRYAIQALFFVGAEEDTDGTIK